MIGINCVIKTLKDEKDNIIWEALYINGKKQIEDTNLDKEAAIKLFNKNDNYKNVIIKENYVDEESAGQYFPTNDDFIDLLDYGQAKVGSFIYLEDGIYEIETISDEYRTSDYYDITIWSKIDNKYYSSKDKTFFSGHVGKKLKLKGKKKGIFFEDYNYQQSYLFLKLKQDGIL